MLGQKISGSVMKIKSVDFNMFIYSLYDETLCFSLHCLVQLNCLISWANLLYESLFWPLATRISGTKFFTIWSNPDTTAHQIVHYLLMMTDDSSTTWATHLRILSRKYCLPDPLYLLERTNIMSKEQWKTLINTKITIFHEKELRSLAQDNSKMRFLNV